MFAVERKTTVNIESSQALHLHLVNTAKALRLKLGDEDFCARLNITNSNPSIHMVLFCQAGDDEVLQRILKAGVYVVKDGTTFCSPPSPRRF